MKTATSSLCPLQIHKFTKQTK
uniref:Uncharacterized protein n=1 Tax=Anguilla anguilla TaxID=7936 RepID=A0A0E9QZW6_ANGAN